MKKLFITTILIASANLSAQYKKLDVIDFENSSFDIELKGSIEINGHTFDNKKSKDPIRFKSNLEISEIYDSKREYQKRECDVEKCKVIHLEPKSYGTSILSGWGVTTPGYNNLEYKITN